MQPSLNNAEPMETADLADHIIASAKDEQRHIVAVAGPPGAGKSTLAANIALQLEERSIASRIIPMDGFHLDNAVLKQRDLLNRKGAPQTFDAEGFVHLIRRLVGHDQEVAIPTFDRERDIAIAGAEIIVEDDLMLIVEGNYLLSREAPWSELQSFWDTTVFINPGFDVLENRLIERWIGFGFKEADAKARAMGNDIPNAKYVLEHSVPAQIQLTG